MNETGNVFKKIFAKISSLPVRKTVPSKTAVSEPVRKEAVTQEQKIGELFEKKLRETNTMPPILDELGGASGLLATNEDLPDTVIDQVRMTAPDGYIVGAGFGNILAMTLFFNEHQPPKSILAMDVMPEVVVTGRVIVKLIGQSEDFLTFWKSLTETGTLKMLYDGVIADEENDRIQQRLKDFNFESMTEELKQIVGREYLPQSGYRISVPFSNNQRLSVIAIIKDRFDILHSLAKTGNIGVGYADMTDPSILEIIKSMPDFSEAKNVIYMSNVIDHLTRRGSDLSRIHDMDTLSLVDNGNSTFVDTTQQSLDYELRANREVPQYTESDLIYRL